jgi:hypothetical protein
LPVRVTITRKLRQKPREQHCRVSSRFQRIWKYKAEKHGVGEYEVILKDTLKPGVIAITATIQAGELNDLLTGELDLHEDEDEPVSGSSWKGIALWIGGGLMALMALGAIVRFRQQARTA